MKRLSYLIAFLFIASTSIASEPCPKTFDSFIELFQNKSSFQAGHIRYPLIYYFVDINTKPEPRRIKLRLSKHNYLKTPGAHYPSKQIAEKMNLYRKITTYPNGTVHVRFDKPDSDVFSVEYNFVTFNGCWQLIEVDDQSL
jgi:hypothetical protein